MRIVINEFISLDGVTLAATGVQICKFRPTGEPLRPGHSDELYENGNEPVPS